MKYTAQVETRAALQREHAVSHRRDLRRDLVHLGSGFWREVELEAVGEVQADSDPRRDLAIESKLAEGAQDAHPDDARRLGTAHHLKRRHADQDRRRREE